MGKSKNKFRGIFNRYRKEMTLDEIILKDINYFLLALKNYFKNGFKRHSVLVYPHYPSRGSTIYKVSNIMGYNVTNKFSVNNKFGVYWEYLTHRKEFEKLEVLSKEKKIINLFSRDISKQYVDKIHHEIFGYSTIVDPTTFSGKIVKKSDENAMHDGVILNGPLKENEKEYIYQILIDNTFEKNLVKDIRIPVVGKETLDFSYIKLRDIGERFKNTTVKTTIKNTSELFSSAEIQQINDFSKALKLEYGELDVLRNKTDGKIYIVDVNNTPQGPPANTSKLDGQRVLTEIKNSLLSYLQQ